MGRLRVGINGFGRIGRILFRAANDKLDIVGVNDPGGPKAAAHLLKYDSTHGIFPGDIHAEGNALYINDKKIPFSNTRNPEEIPWKDWETDMVLECTGAFKTNEDLSRHMKDSNVKRVLVSAPAPGADLTMVYGINHESYDPEKHTIVSNASCTTNCLAPMVKVLHENFGIETGFMTTVHSYTNDQRVLDNNHKDLRRARAAAMSMIPTTTGAAVAVTEVMPELAGKLDGMAVRVPTPNVSLVDLVANISKPATEEQINQALIAAAEGSLKSVLDVSSEPLVSSDYNGNPNSSIIDLLSTKVIGDRFIKVLSWYDNETGFSERMIDFALYMNEKGI